MIVDVDVDVDVDAADVVILVAGGSALIALCANGSHRLMAVINKAYDVEVVDERYLVLFAVPMAFSNLKRIVFKWSFSVRNRYKITYVRLFPESLRHRYKITCPKLFSKSLKRQAIL